MNVGEMIKAVGRYIDDVVQAADCIPLLNAGQNRMAIEAGASFPQFTITPDLIEEPVFPVEYHELPVLYAAAMFRSADDDYRGKESLMMQFERGVQNFSENYDPPVQYRTGAGLQQFTATAGQTLFTITKEGFHPRWGRPKVYVNGVLMPVAWERDPFDYDGYYDYNGNTITLNALPAPLAEGDRVTVMWDSNPDFTVRPAYYAGW